MLDEVRPAAHFIIDEANLYSVKPLLMFDAAEIPAGVAIRAEGGWPEAEDYNSLS